MQVVVCIRKVPFISLSNSVPKDKRQLKELKNALCTQFHSCMIQKAIACHILRVWFEGDEIKNHLFYVLIN